MQSSPPSAARNDNVVALSGVPLPRAGRRSDDQMSFAEVARALCIDHYHRPQTIIEKLRVYHRHMAMPLPQNPRVLRGVPCQGADNICQSSVWSRARFMNWYYGAFGGPVEDPTAPARSRHRLAANIGLVSGGAS